MEKILRGMMDTMVSVKPPRMTALRELHEAETGVFSILIGTILSARTKDQTTSAVVKKLFTKIKKALTKQCKSFLRVLVSFTL